MSQVLFASNIAFSRKNGSVTQQELNLFELAASRVAPTRATTAKIMRRKLLYPGSCRALFDDVPDDVVGQPVSPNHPVLADRPKQQTFLDARRCRPIVNRIFHPTEEPVQCECGQTCQLSRQWPTDPPSAESSRIAGSPLLSVAGHMPEEGKA